MALARTRTLEVRNGVATSRDFGTWLEIIDGGTYGYRNTLYLETEGDDPAFSGENGIPCIAGTIVRARFDQLRVVAPGAYTDTVRVRVGDGPPPEAVTGKPRVDWLASGTTTIETTSELIPVDFSGTAARSDYSTLERHELLDWHGFIVGNKVFRVLATVLLNGVEMVVSEYDVRLVTPPVGSTATIASYSCEFFDLTTRQRARFPSNLWRLHVVNSSGATPVDCVYLIGVRG